MNFQLYLLQSYNELANVFTIIQVLSILVFRAIGDNFVDLGLLKERQDVFYLTVEEIFAFVEGRAVTNNVSGLVELRRQEYDGYRKVCKLHCKSQ